MTTTVRVAALVTALALLGTVVAAPAPTAAVQTAPPVQTPPATPPAAPPTAPPSTPPGAPAVSPAEAGAENRPAEGEMSAELFDAVGRGFVYLKRQQMSDGSFGRGRYANHVGITALCALAFMADGHLPGRGEYGDNVSRALEFVLSHAGETGLIAADTSHGPMYGHGFATLFLGEIYGMSATDEHVREVLVKAVELIVRTQNDEGGWRYNPVPYEADISVTICQIMALRSARNAGIKVPRDTIDRAISYVRACQNGDGGFKYMLQSGGSEWPRTAAGVASLFYAGVYEDDSIERGLEYLRRNALPGLPNIPQTHYYYGQYYAVQAMYLAGGDWWKQWWPAVREELLNRQASSGGWLDHYAGGAYATAMSLIVLQMPKRYLPIFQR